MASRPRPHMPSEIDDHVGMFDRFAGWCAVQTARAPFFALCVTLVIVWLPSFPLFGDVNTWSFAINNPTTVVTFLLISLMQNAAARSEAANNHRQNAIAQGVAVVLDLLSHDCDEVTAVRAAAAADELRAAVGIEDRETA